MGKEVEEEEEIRSLKSSFLLVVIWGNGSDDG
jgi:hypothetical protein